MRRPMPWTAPLLLSLLLAACAGAPAPRPSPAASGLEPREHAPAADPRTAPLDAPLPFDPQVRKGRLANGFTYLVRANREPANRADLWLVVDAGSVLEDEDQQGLAHFVEHMAFNGTERFAEQELIHYLESIGMRFGPDINAYTTFDETVYMLRLPTDDPGIVDTALDILEDWARGVTFDPVEVDKERGVVIEEWRLGRGADARLLDEQYPVLLAGSRYAERLPIGEVEVLRNAPREALVRFYRDWYRPDLMALVAVGDFDPAAMEAQVRRRFTDLAGPPDPRPRESFPVPGHEETLISIATDPEATDTTVGVYTKHPRASQGTYGDYRRSLVEVLFDNMLNARLAEVAQRPDPPFLWAVSASGNLARTADLYYQVAAVEESGVERGLAALLAEVERVDRHGFVAGELARAKADLLRGYEQAYQEREHSDSRTYAAEYSRHFLDGESVPGIATELALARRFMEEIELAEINAQVREWISDENRVILLSAPEKAAAALPAESELLAAFAAVEEQPLEPWVDRVLDEPLVAAAPPPAPVVEEATRPELGVTEWRLANGVEVVLKPTDFRQDQVLLTGFSPGGDSLASDEEYLSASFATAVVGEGGLGPFDAIELEKALAGSSAGVRPFIGELEEGLTGFASPDDLETLLQLVYLTFTAPRADDEAFGSFLQKTRPYLENRLARPETVFQDALVEALSQGHPRRRPLTPEDLDDVDLEAALAFYRERFADASDFTFILVGSFQPEAVRPLVETYLGGLPAAGREESFRDVGVTPPDGVVKLEVEKGLEPKSLVQIIFHGPAEWSRENLHAIDTLSTVLGTRLREVLREDLGATYGVGTSGSIAPRPRQQYRFAVSFGTAPEKVDELVAQIFREIEALRRGEIDAADLANAKEAQLRERELLLADNAFWLQALKTYYSLGLEPEGILAFDELVAAMTPEALQEAARRYLDPERYLIGVLRPQPRQEEAGAAR